MAFRHTLDRRELPTYGITESAHFLGMPVATLTSWVNGRAYPTNSGPRLFKPLVELASPGLLSFYNLVEAHILLSTRKTHQSRCRRFERHFDTSKGTIPLVNPLLSEIFPTTARTYWSKNIREGPIASKRSMFQRRGGQLGFQPNIRFLFEANRTR